MLVVDGEAGGPAACLVSVIEGSDRANHSDTEEFFDSNYGDSSECRQMVCEDGFAKGFVDGAMEVWYQVKDAI